MVDFSSSSRSGGKNGEIEVSFGKEKLRVPLPPPNSPLSSLKAVLFNMTGISPDKQTLISNGAILKDELAPLSAFGLVDDEEDLNNNNNNKTASTSTSFWDTWSFRGNKDSGRKLKKLILIGSKETLSRVDDKLFDRKIPVVEEVVEKVVDDEPTFVSKILEISTKRLDELEPEIAKLEAWLSQENGTAKVESTEGVEAEVLEKPNPRTPIFLSEALLQSLLKLDGFNIPSTYLEARKERKEAVRKLQGALDRVDAAKEALKSKL